MKRSRSILICLAGALILGAGARAGNPATPGAPGPGQLPSNELREKTVMMNKMLLLKKLRERDAVRRPMPGGPAPAMTTPRPTAAIHAPTGNAPADNLPAGNPYGSIVTRNVFGLNPPPPPTPPDQGTPPPKITLTGITTIFGPPEALFKVAGVPRPGVPPKDESYILTEGESQDDVQVQHIDVEKGIVTFINHEVVQDIPLAAGVASGGSPEGGGGPGGGASFPGQRFRGGPGGFNNSIQNFRQRFQQQRMGNGYNSSGNNYNPAGQISYGNNGYNPNNSTPQLSGDDAAALIAAQHAQLQQEGNPMAAIFPPTSYDNQANAEASGSGSAGSSGASPPVRGPDGLYHPSIGAAPTP